MYQGSAQVRAPATDSWASWGGVMGPAAIMPSTRRPGPSSGQSKQEKGQERIGHVQAQENGGIKKENRGSRFKPLLCSRH